MRENAGLIVFAVLCIYPLLFFAVPGYLIGRYRLRLRSPVVFKERLEPAQPRQSRSLLRKIEEDRRDRIGYGAEQ